MAIQLVATLKNLIIDVVKVFPNTDPTKTEGIRLRGLLVDMYDTLEDLVNKLGLSMSSLYQTKAEAFSGSYTALSNIPVTFAPTSHLHEIADINGLATQLGVTPRVFTSEGIITRQAKRWVGIVTPTMSNGYVIDISSAGFTEVFNVQVSPETPTSSISSIPIVAIKSITNTQVTVNILVSNSVLPVLGTVISGLVFATNMTGLRIHAEVLGY